MKLMKRTVLFIAALLLSVSAFAGVVTRSQAESVARNFFGESAVQFASYGLAGTATPDSSPAFYIFNGNGQWVIIAADDIAAPVLMHGNGHLDIESMPDNMREFLGDIEHNILEAKAAGVPQSSEIKAIWANLAVRTKAEEPEEIVLHTARWSQGSPFNDLCLIDPLDTCAVKRHSVTGCVATAMAIVMQYHKWPEHGTGTIPSYTTSTRKIVVDSIDISAHTYNWDLMPTYGCTGMTAEEKAEAKVQMATLLLDCGAMVQMDYTYEGSGAYGFDVAPAMVKYMSYSSSARNMSRQSFTNQQWFNKIKAEIDAGRPVLYGGQDINNQGGHQFVCDGYNSIGQVRINWGWGQSEDTETWYTVSYLGGAYSQGYVFSKNDAAIFGLAPDKSADHDGSYPELFLTDNGIDITGTVAKGSTFAANVHVYNYARDGFSGTVGMLLVDKAGNVKEVLEEITVEGMNRYGYRLVQFKNLCITKDPALGDRIVAGIKVPSGSSYTWEILSNNEFSNVIRGSYGVFDIAMIDVPSSVNSGQIMYPGIIPGQKTISSVSWYLDSAPIPSDSVTVSETGAHTLKAVVTYKDGSTETIVKEVTVN